MKRLPNVSDVLEDIAEHLRTTRLEACRLIAQFAGPAISNLQDQTRLAPPSEVTQMDVPICREMSDDLIVAIPAHPEWFTSSDYPKPIVDFLRRCDIPEPLGRYFPSSRHIEIYWLAIAWTAMEEKWGLGDLLNVVLIHEWAHAFTDRGLDADGKAGCIPSDSGVCEGIAQYWTHYALLRMQHTQSFAVFLALCRFQQPMYHAHIPWLSGHRLCGALAKNFGAVYQNLGLDVEPSAPFGAVYERIGIKIRTTALAGIDMPICEGVRQAVRYVRYQECRRRCATEEGVGLASFDEFLSRVELGQICDVF